MIVLMNEVEKQYFAETEKSLKSSDRKIVRSRIRELKTTGNAKLLPLILNLFLSEPEEEIRQEIVSMLGDLRDQHCAGIMTRFIAENQEMRAIDEIIATCWQSRLDYSEYLDTFAESFIRGNYQTAIESFTVIEESIWKAKKEALDSCLTLLEGRSKDVDEVKKPLYHELLHVLASGRTQNSEDYPELYPEG